MSWPWTQAWLCRCSHVIARSTEGQRSQISYPGQPLRVGSKGLCPPCGVYSGIQLRAGTNGKREPSRTIGSRKYIFLRKTLAPREPWHICHRVDQTPYTSFTTGLVTTLGSETLLPKRTCRRSSRCISCLQNSLWSGRTSADKGVITRFPYNTLYRFKFFFLGQNTLL